MAHGLAATRAAFAVAREDAPDLEEEDGSDEEEGIGSKKGKGKKKKSNKWSKGKKRSPSPSPSPTPCPGGYYVELPSFVARGCKSGPIKVGEDLNFGIQCRDLFLNTLFRGDPANEGAEGASVNSNPEEGFEFYIEWVTDSSIAGLIAVNGDRVHKVWEHARPLFARAKRIIFMGRDALVCDKPTLAYLLQACTADIIYCFDDGAGRAVYEVHYAPELLFQLRGKAKRVGLPIDHMEIGASTQETFPTNKQQHQRGRLCASSQRHLYHCSAELPRQ